MVLLAQLTIMVWNYLMCFHLMVNLYHYG